ncbi:hypothetical protein M3J09_006205 [Ascochyta lentis]
MKAVRSRTCSCSSFTTIHSSLSTPTPSGLPSSEGRKTSNSHHGNITTEISTFIDASKAIAAANLYLTTSCLA